MTALRGPIGLVIKSRLDSAAIRCKPKTWEDLYMYIVQDPKWDYDHEIIREWRVDITSHFLACCKKVVDEDVVAKYERALEDCVQNARPSKEDTEDGGYVTASDYEPRSSALRAETLQAVEHNTHTSAPHADDQIRPSRITFFLTYPNNSELDSVDGVMVKYEEIPRSKIDESVIRRWDMDERIYTSESNSETSGVMVIDLTWTLSSKSYTTTFEVVSATDIQSDVVFGRNRFMPPSRKQKSTHGGSSHRGGSSKHTASKSSPVFPTMNNTRVTSNQRITSGTKARRDTDPSVGMIGRDEYVLRGVGQFLGYQYDDMLSGKSSSAAYGEDDNLSVESERPSASSPNTSVGDPGVRQRKTRK